MIEPVFQTDFNPDELIKKLNEVVGSLNMTLQESVKKDALIDQYAAENICHFLCTVIYRLQPPNGTLYLI